jgi:hypothetical protein
LRASLARRALRQGGWAPIFGGPRGETEIRHTNFSESVFQKIHRNFFQTRRPPPRCAARVRGPCRPDGACRRAGHRTPASRRRFTSDASGPAALPSVRHGLRLGAPNVCPWKLNDWFSLAFMRPRIPPDYRRVSVARERSADYRLGACSHFTHRNPIDEFPDPLSIPGDPARPASGGEARLLAPCGALPLRVIPPFGRPHGGRLANTRRPSESRVHRAAPRSGDRETQ